MPTIDTWLAKATQTLRTAGILTARLDALVLLGDELQKDKGWLLAHLEESISQTALERLDAKLAARAGHIPLAYLRGVQAFYGRLFDVTPDVLIPRPETEACIELIRQVGSHGHLLDVGTGSGAIAITAALEFPGLQVEACDISPPALAIARQNAAKFEAPVHFFESNLLAFADGPYDGIVANLPYVGRDWPRSPETAAEPALALFADDDGLALISELIRQAPAKLAANGWLILEADPKQHAAIKKTAAAHEFALTAAEGFALAFARRKGQV